MKNFQIQQNTMLLFRETKLQKLTYIKPHKSDIQMKWQNKIKISSYSSKGLSSDLKTE